MPKDISGRIPEQQRPSNRKQFETTFVTTAPEGAVGRTLNWLGQEVTSPFTGKMPDVYPPGDVGRWVQNLEYPENIPLGGRYGKMTLGEAQANVEKSLGELEQNQAVQGVGTALRTLPITAPIFRAIQRPRGLPIPAPVAQAPQPGEGGPSALPAPTPQVMPAPLGPRPGQARPSEPPTPGPAYPSEPLFPTNFGAGWGTPQSPHTVPMPVPAPIGRPPTPSQPELYAPSTTSTRRPAGLPVLASNEEYDQLSPGDRFVWQHDGNTYLKT